MADKHVSAVLGEDGHIDGEVMEGRVIGGEMRGLGDIVGTVSLLEEMRLLHGVHAISYIRMGYQLISFSHFSSATLGQLTSGWILNI